jgi:hypothetical protein
MVKKVLIERLAWEMAQWEIHALRGLVTTLVLLVQIYARSHPEAKPLARHLVQVKDHLREDQIEALMDPVKRNQA